MTTYPTIYRPREDVTLYLGDCLTILPTLTGVDAVITDPPYGIGGSPKRGGAKQGTLNYENGGGGVIFDWDKADYSWLGMWEGPAAVFCSPRQISEYAASMKPDGMLVYLKTNPHPCGSSFEPCLTRGMGTGGRHVSAYNAENGQTHPTQKPLAVMLFVVSRAPESATVLDPFMGSGTTGVACIRTGRKFIGIEIDPTHYATACRRIDNELQQMTLPVAEAKV